MLEIEPDVELTATEQAKEDGLPLAEYAGSVFKAAILKRQNIKLLSEKSFDEVLKPFRDEVEASGITDDELDDLFLSARREIRSERKISNERK